MSAKPLLYLASASPRRQELLRQIGVGFELLAPGPDEDAEALEAPLRGETPAAYVMRVTRLKVEAARARLKRRGLRPAPLLCADTTVALGRRILGKPDSTEEALGMLALLAGRSHRVLTAVAVASGSHVETILSTSHVHMAALDAAERAAYVASGEPFGKAGGYGIQGRAACFISRITGSYSGIMGLPLYETTQLLRQAGL